jgi:hypothetical protein
MLSKLRYNNICKKFISILNTTSETFARVLSKINNDKLNNNDGKIFKLNSISTKDNQIPSFIYKNLYNYLFDGLAKL